MPVNLVMVLYYAAGAKKVRKERLRINLLGKPEVWLDGVQLTSFSTAKTEALLYYLAATGQAHSRETLAGLLWGEMPEANARRNLTKSLSVLRRLLKPFLLIEPQRVGLVPNAAVALDVAHLTTAVSSPQPSPDVTTLYRGDFLEGFFVKDALAFDEWLLTQREHFREMAIGALEKLMMQAASKGKYAVGITYGRQLLELDPWREPVHRQLMLLLARHGQLAAALAQYEQCCQILADELGVEPMPETTALFQRIQLARQDRPYRLPAAATPFVGRAEELTHIGRLLADPNCRLLTLVGLGGMGKTRLALAAAQQANKEQAWQFLHGVLFVSLTAVAAPDQLPTALADALDFPLGGRQDPVEQLSHYLQDKELLLVLDNFEHLLPGTAVLNRLLRACPDITFLVTSRESLQIEAEHRFDVAGLPFPASGEQLTDLQNSDYRLLNTEYPAIQLFLQAARQVQPQFGLTPEITPDVMHICSALSGIPLAIKLAASWLRVLTCTEIAAEIERGLDLLTTRMHDVPSRQRSMTAVFDHSWAMLTPVEQDCLAGLSVFRDGFTARAARTIAGASLATLASLVDRALLHLDKTPQGARYYLHELTRQYAAEKLAASPETAVAVQTAHTRHYAHQMEVILPELSGKSPNHAFEAIHREIGNIRLAWEQATQQADLANLSRLMAPLADFYTRQGWFTEGQERLAAAITSIQATNHQGKTAVRLLGELLARQGALVGRIGQFDAAEAALQQSIELARQAEDPHLLALALVELGTLLRDRSRFAEATQAIEESLDIAVELNDGPLIARTTEKMGLITWDQGSHVTAQEKLTEALTLFREQENTREIAIVLNSLGNVLMSMGDDRAALAHYQEALPVVRALENWLFLDTLLINLGMISNNLGDHVQARSYYEESLNICHRIGDEIGVAYCLTGIGQTVMEEGDLAKARTYFEQSLALNQKMGRERYVGINLNFLGDVALGEEAWQAARTYYEESLKVSKRISHPWGMASSHLRLGDLDVIQDEETAASQHYLAALSLGQEMEAPVFVLTAVTNLAGQLLKFGEVETAVSALLIVQKQPAISDSLRQTVVDLLAQETAAFLAQQEEMQAQARRGTLATVVTDIQALFVTREQLNQ